MTNWIPVSERLPEEGVRVLIYQTYWHSCPVTIGYIKQKEYFENGSYNGGYWIWYDSGIPIQKNLSRTACPGDEYVKAWMPLPEPYKEDE